MAASIVYTSAAGGRVTVVEGSAAQLAYARSRLWTEGERSEVEAPAEVVRESPVDRAAASALANLEAKLADLSPETVVAGNVGEVKAAVLLAGPAFAAEVLKIERAGQARTTLIAWLTEQAGDLATPTPEAQAQVEVEGEGEQPQPEAEAEQTEGDAEPGPTY